jgi:hypothetical protein
LKSVPTCVSVDYENDRVFFGMKNNGFGLYDLQTNKTIILTKGEGKRKNNNKKSVLTQSGHIQHVLCCIVSSPNSSFSSSDIASSSSSPSSSILPSSSPLYITGSRDKTIRVYYLIIK